MKKYMLLLFIFSSFSSFSEVFNEDEFVDEIETRVMYYESRNCTRYKGEYEPRTRYLEICKAYYHTFLSELGHTRVDTLDFFGNDNPRFVNAMARLWHSKNRVFRQDPLHRSALATIIAKFKPRNREYLTSDELETWAFSLLESSESTYYLKVNGLRILAGLGEPNYIYTMKDIAKDNVDNLGINAIYLLGSIIREREILKEHLYDIYQRTNHEEIKIFLDDYIKKEGGWVEGG